MPPLEVLELHLAPRAAGNEPVGTRPAEAVAEDDIQAPGNLVDEVIHVGLMTAVIVAGEHDAGLVVEEDPAREVDRLHSRQVAAGEDVAARELDGRQYYKEQSATEPTWLDRPEGRVLVADVEVL